MLFDEIRNPRGEGLRFPRTRRSEDLEDRSWGGDCCSLSSVEAFENAGH